MKRITIGKGWIIAMAAVVALLGINLVGTEIAIASGPRFTGWVLCTPHGSVNVRSRPDVSGQKTGRLYLGDRITIDATTKKGGWVHSPDLPTDAGEGWISCQFVTTEPVELGLARMRVDAGGRVAAWEGMNCRKRNCWLQTGDTVDVYATSGEWAVTEKGFVRLEYLTL